MSIISYIKRIFRIKPKISKIKVFYIKAFKAYNFTEDFIRVLLMMNFDERNAFVRTFENTVVYIILKKDDTLFLFIPKSYLERVKEFAETHELKIIGADNL